MRDETGRRVKAGDAVLVAEARDRAKHLRADMKAQPAKYSPGMRRTIKDDVPALCDLVDALAGEVEARSETLKELRFRFVQRYTSPKESLCGDGKWAVDLIDRALLKHCEKG